MGDLLRQEVAKKGAADAKWKMVSDLMSKGEMVPEVGLHGHVDHGQHSRHHLYSPVTSSAEYFYTLKQNLRENKVAKATTKKQNPKTGCEDKSETDFSGTCE